MKILLVTNLFPTPFDPERGVFTLQLAKRLQNHCDVTVVCPLPWLPNWKIFKNAGKWAQYSQVPQTYSIDGIKVYSPKYLLIPKISENIHDKLMSFGLSSCIKSLHKTAKFDVVNSQWLYPDSVAVDAVIKEINIPHIPTGLGSDINREMHDGKKGIKILDMLIRSSAITVVSNNLKTELISNKIEENKITVIPNGIDTKRFKILDKAICRDTLNISNDGIPIIIYVGRLSEEKSISTLVNATHNLIQTSINVKVYLIGDGPELTYLSNLVNNLDISKHITFVGKVDHQEISKWMGASDYLCLPSIMEGCPNVILEALGSGRPVIASKVGAIPDIVTNKSGILFEAQDVADLTDSIKTALKVQWNAEEIIESVRHLSWEEAAKKYFDVFNSTISIK